jgi:HAD superfamily hydrolase (TIGR01509 family)
MMDVNTARAPMLISFSNAHLAASAVIFDMDGVLSDTQSLHAFVEAELFAERGITITPQEITAQYAGVADADFFRAVLGNDLADRTLDALIREKWQRMMARSAGIQPIEGAVELVGALAAGGTPLAVASSSPLPFIDHVLDALDIAGSFRVRASAEEVPRGKPAPDVFLLAARRLRVEPARCTVIEDALAGMQAAARAGMRCIALVADPSREVPADLRVSALRELLDRPELLWPPRRDGRN